MHIDIFFQRNLQGEPLVWADKTTPGSRWIKLLGVVVVLDWRKRLAPEPRPFDGTCFAPKRPRRKLA